MKILEEIEKAEKKRHMLSEENSRKIVVKPMPVQSKGLKPFGDASQSRLSKLDMN